MELFSSNGDGTQLKCPGLLCAHRCFRSWHSVVYQLSLSVYIYVFHRQCTVAWFVLSGWIWTEARVCGSSYLPRESKDIMFSSLGQVLLERAQTQTKVWRAHVLHPHLAFLFKGELHSRGQTLGKVPHSVPYALRIPRGAWVSV